MSEMHKMYHKGNPKKTTMPVAKENIALFESNGWILAEPIKEEKPRRKVEE